MEIFNRFNRRSASGALAFLTLFSFAGCGRKTSSPPMQAPKGESIKKSEVPMSLEFLERLRETEGIESVLPGKKHQVVIISPEAHSLEAEEMQFERISRVNGILPFDAIFLEGRLGRPFSAEDQKVVKDLNLARRYDQNKVDPALEELFGSVDEGEGFAPYDKQLKDHPQFLKISYGLETPDTIRWATYGVPAAYSYDLIAQSQATADSSNIPVPLKSPEGTVSAVLRLDKIEEAARKEFKNYPDFELSKLPLIKTKDGMAYRVLNEDSHDYVNQKIVPQFLKWNQDVLIERRTAKWAEALISKLEANPSWGAVFITCGTRHAMRMREFPEDSFPTIGEQLNKAGYSCVVLSGIDAE